MFKIEHMRLTDASRRATPRGASERLPVRRPSLAKAAKCRWEPASGLGPGRSPFLLDAVNTGLAHVIGNRDSIESAWVSAAGLATEMATPDAICGRRKSPILRRLMDLRQAVAAKKRSSAETAFRPRPALSGPPVARRVHPHRHRGPQGPFAAASYLATCPSTVAREPLRYQCRLENISAGRRAACRNRRSQLKA
jgi:hypothetical protein